MGAISYDIDQIQSNIVSGETLRKIQGNVLRDLKDAIAHSMGPAGSNTLILKGASSADLVAAYSKDGHKIIKNIMYQNPIEMSIQTEIEEITRYVERVVGDGTTSAVILSSLIFDAMTKYIEENNIKYPYKIIRDFQAAVKLISEEIRKNGRECTLDDIYSLALISTNGNTRLSEELATIYKEHGMDVYIDVNASTDEESYIKDYDGISFDSGYSDPAYINDASGVSRIRGTADYPDLRVYYFADPVDTVEQTSLFQSIIQHNIITPSANRQPCIPTVILVPLIGKDNKGFMRNVVKYLYQFNEEQYSQKPPLLVITNFAGLDRNHVDNIMNLCNCPPIQKYINDEQQLEDQKNGRTPTIDNVHEFYGTCSMVEADSNKTRFIDPVKMYEKDEDGNKLLDEHGLPIPCKEYKSILEFLKAELKRAQETGEHPGQIGALKRQLHTMNANMVEYFVGGVSISDRDSARDLVEDAVLNCRSAAAYGVGYAACFEGLRASKFLASLNENESLRPYLEIIYSAYIEYLRLLYSTVKAEDDVNPLVKLTFDAGCPMNLVNGEFDYTVLTSIESDPTILDAISKIVTIMLTANQALVQSPNINMY